MTDCTSLTGYAAAGNAADNVELAEAVGEVERLTNNEFQRFKAEIIVNVSAVDGDIAVASAKTRTRATELFLLPVP